MLRLTGLQSRGDLDLLVPGVVVCIVVHCGLLSNVSLLFGSLQPFFNLSVIGSAKVHTKIDTIGIQRVNLNDNRDSFSARNQRLRSLLRFFMSSVYV